MLLAIAFVIIGLALLVWGADKFVDGASGIAKNFEIPPIVIGLTIVSMCTSLPEMIVSGIAAAAGNNNLGIGNVIGSNIANIGLVLGITALISPVFVKAKILRREFPVLILITCLALGLMLDGELGFIDGLVLLTGVIALVYWLYVTGMKERDAALAAEFEDSIPHDMTLKASIVWLIIGLLVMIGSSRMVVQGAVEIATMLGVSNLVIGLTIVAIGTSLPEMVASVMSVLKNEADLAIGNIIGSNMFNTLAVLAMPALIAPGQFDAATLTRDFPVMLAFAAALFVVAFSLKGKGKVTRVEGGVLLSGFCAYLTVLVLQA